MRRAIALARQGQARAGTNPIGCVLVREGELLSEACNEVDLRHDPTAHAEILAIRSASERLRSWRLEGATFYVTLEPCAMCAGALVQARVVRVVYGCDDAKAGALRSLFTIGEDARLNHRFEVVPGVRAKDCASRMSSFFAALRALGKK